MEDIVRLFILICQLLTAYSDTPGLENRAISLSLNRRLLEGNDEIEARIQKLEDKITKLTACVSQSGVAFTASLSAHKPSIAPHQIVDFDKIITNYGNGYNPATSIFTAPTDGVYMFDVNIGVSSGDEDVEIVKNGTHLQRIYGYSTDHWEVSSAAVSTHLVKGDQVWVKAYEYNTGLVGHELTSFSGVLVQPDCSL